VWILALPWLATALVIVALRWLPPPVTSFMLQSPIEPVDYRWVDWPDISPALRLAAVAAEDQRFVQHHGFDIDAISNAIADQRRRRGASTISQQVAKNLFLWPGGGYFRKSLEAGLTVLLEAALPKRRILEIYLNIVEFGPGIYGAEAAAHRYFGTSARHLTSHQAALLAAVLPSPRRYNPADPSPYHRRRAAWIEAQMRHLGPGWLAALQ